MGIGTFKSHFAINHDAGFKGFFSIVPSTTCIILEHCPKYATYCHTSHITTQHFRNQLIVFTIDQFAKQNNGNWETDGQDSWQHHFAQGCFCRYFNTFAIFWFSSSFHNSRNFLELTTHFIYHVHGSFSNRVHCQSRKHHWNHTTHE